MIGLSEGAGSRGRRLGAVALLVALAGGLACSPDGARPPAAVPPSNAPSTLADADPGNLGALADPRRVVPWTGDFDGMVERRRVRILVTYSRTHYFVDRGTQRGLTYELGRLFEDDVNRQLGRDGVRLHVVFLPVSHDQLIPALLGGRGDVAAANLAVTPERRAEVDFSDPVWRDVEEIVVTGPSGPPLASAEDLSGSEVYVRRSSSFFTSVEALNRRLAASGRPLVRVREAPEVLADEDVLEMVNAGLVPATVVHRHIAEFWGKVFDRLVLHREARLRTGGEVALMIRKGSPRLRSELDAFLARYPQGGVVRNTLLQRYLRGTKYALAATAPAERRKFEATVDLFRRYGDRYSLDYLLMMAQAYQESRLDQGAKSPVGAIGIMQLMPATGKELGVGDVRQLEPNVHAGVKYIRFLVDQYYANEPMTPIDKGLFAFASYNAGPARIRQLRRRAADRGLDPNVWFNNVELVCADAIGRETVQYVSNIYKYYLAYKMVMEQREEVEAVKGQALAQIPPTDQVRPGASPTHVE